MNKRVILLAGVLSTMALTLMATVGLTGAELKTNNQIGGVKAGAENGYDYSVTFTPYSIPMSKLVRCHHAFFKNLPNLSPIQI